MKNLIILLLSAFYLVSCTKAENIKKASGESIFQLESTWENQEGQFIKLSDLKGKNLVVVMIFTNCKTSCPILVADMKKIYSALDKKKLKETSLVLVSIDPQNDTPEKLTEFAKQNGMYGDPWIFLRSNDEHTREFANVLSMNYKQITPVEFSHSNIISIFNKNGEMVSQEEGAGINSAAVAATVNQLN